MSTFEYKLADIGEGIDAAELIEWHVAVGDSVREDQPLAEMQTDKAIVVIPAPATGVVAELRFEPGDSVPVGSVLAVIELGTHEIAAHEISANTGMTNGEANVAFVASAPLASPAVRRFARGHGVDLAAVNGTGPNGRIRREDVERVLDAVAPAPASAPGPEPTPVAVAESATVIPLRGVRRVIARKMTEAWRTVPHIIDYREADMGRMIELRDRLRARARARDDEVLARAMTLTPLLVKIACRALAEHPDVNASLDMEREQIVRHSRCHIGIATSTLAGLLVPVVRGAESYSVSELARTVAELTSSAREGRLAPESLQSATFTVNNFGALGIWLGTPLIVPPQVANLGIGRVSDRPVVREGEIVAAPVAALSVSGDHRVLDGDTLAAFVTRVVELIEEPALLLEEAR